MMTLCCEVLQALKGKTLVTAESCTGGGIGAALTAVPGSSQVYKGGVISYTDWVKAHVLGAPEALLAQNQDSCIRMPMREGCRSLNLSNSVAVGVYEVLRQWDFPELLDHGHLRDYEWK